MVGGDGGVRRTPSAGTRGPPSARSTTATASRRTTMTTPSTAAPTPTATGEAYDLGLEHFFLQDTSTIGQRRRTTGARSVATTTTRSRQRPRQCATPAATLSKKKSSRTPPRRRHHRESSTEEAEAGEEEEEDTRSFDLDLATARETFQQQHVHEQLQLHLTKTDELLYSVFPKHVAETLRNGHKVAPENHDRVTIYFSDIVGFTDISSQLDPLEISDLLDRLYNSFDALSEYHDVFKVETIGDA